MEAHILKALIITEKAEVEIKKRKVGNDRFMKEVINRKLTMVFLTKDVSKFCADHLLDGRKIKFRNLCLFKAYSGRTIAAQEVAEVLSRIKADSDQVVMISSDRNDYAAARRNSVPFAHYDRFSDKNPMIKRPFKCLDRIEHFFDVLD